MEDAEALAPGTRRGRHLILARQARPGPRRWPGDTYLAVDRASFEEVTLTVVPRSAFTDVRAAGERLKEELEVARRIFADGFATVLGGEAGGEALSVTTRWIMGIDLRALLAFGPPPLEGAMRVLWEVGDTLSSLHGQGLAHGNLQPGNVILEPDGRAMMVGYRPAPLQELGRAATSDPRGPAYAAPERRDDEAVTPAGDVYSLGVLALELLTGELPADEVGPDTVERLRARIAGEGRRAEGLPASMRALLTAMLDPDPGARPHLAGEVLPALAGATPRGGAGSPPGWGIRPLRALLGLAFEQALADARRAAVARARAQLEVGEVLSACLQLYLASELCDQHEPEITAAIAAGVRACLWESLSLASDGDEEDRDVVQGEAMMALLFKAAFNLRLRKLITVCRHRLLAYTKRESPFAGILPEPPEIDELRRSRPVLLGWARGNPLDEDVLLALAHVTDDFQPRPAATANRRKSDLLRLCGLPAGALYYAALDLPGRGEDLLALERIRKLATEAVDHMRGAPGGEPAGRAGMVQGPPPPSDAPLPGDMLQAEAGPLATPVPGELRPKATRSDALRDAETLFTRGQVLISEGELEAATRTFCDLCESGVLEQEHFHAALCKEVHRLLWRLLACGPRAIGGAATPLALLDLVHGLRLEPLRPIVERLALEALQADGSSVRELLRRAPTSLPALAAACDELGEEEDERRYMRALVDLCSRLVDVGELVAAEVQLRRAEAVDPSSPALAAARERLERARAHRAVVDADLELAREDLLGAASPTRALTLWEGFLGKYSGHPPAMEAAAASAAAARNFARAAHWSLRLGRHHFLCAEDPAARESFRAALRAEPDNQEALLYLAAIESPVAGPEAGDREVRAALLRREELHEVAIHLARKDLRGTPDDLSVHRLLVELCRESGADATDHLLAQGFLALESGDEALARSCFEEAVRDSPAGDTLVDTLIHSPAIHQIFSPTELLRLRA